MGPHTVVRVVAYGHGSGTCTSKPDPADSEEHTEVVERMLLALAMERMLTQQKFDAVVAVNVEVSRRNLECHHTEDGLR